MPSIALQTFLGLIFLIMGLYGSISFSYPQLAFRLENIFELRSVELSGFGMFVQKSGGLLLIGTALGLPFFAGFPILVVPGLVGTAIPLLYFKRTRGTMIVQSMFDPAIDQRIDDRESRNRPG